MYFFYSDSNFGKIRKSSLMAQLTSFLLMLFYSGTCSLFLPKFLRITLCLNPKCAGTLKFAQALIYIHLSTIIALWESCIQRTWKCYTRSKYMKKFLFFKRKQMNAYTTLEYFKYKKLKGQLLSKLLVSIFDQNSSVFKNEDTCQCKQFEARIQKLK